MRIIGLKSTPSLDLVMQIYISSEMEGSWLFSGFVVIFYFVNSVINYTDWLCAITLLNGDSSEFFLLGNTISL